VRYSVYNWDKYFAKVFAVDGAARRDASARTARD
jgi:hypothetical protein